MRIDLHSRTEREKKQYNTGLDRGLWKHLSHCSFFSSNERLWNLRNTLLKHNGGQFLEIGSKTWVQWVQNFPKIIPEKLTCINISEVEIEIGKQLAKHTRIAPTFYLQDAHELSFPDNSFDVVYGNAILHHLDLETVLSQVSRVLKPGGTFWFYEPLDNNYVGRLIRRFTPKARTVDEQPFRHNQLELVKSYFDCEFIWQEFLSVPAGFFSRLFYKQANNGLMRSAHKLDSLIRGKWPSLGPQFRYVVIVGKAHD